MKLYTKLAQLAGAIRRNAEYGSAKWVRRHTETAIALVSAHMPSGSGFDNGTDMDFYNSSEEKLVFLTSFHHTDEHGGYNGWTEHCVTVRGSLASEMRFAISGPNRGDIKEYIHGVFANALEQDYDAMPLEKMIAA